MRIALFITCVNDLMFPETGKAVVRLLRGLGHEVDFPLEQTCCGQMHANTGYREEAVPLVRRFADVFGSYDAVVSPSGSCAAMVRDSYPGLVPRDDRVASVSSRTYELSELLVDVLGVTDTGAYFPHRVTYHPTCHGLRMLGLGDKPLSLLRGVRGIELAELPAAEECCGFGGTFAVKNAEVSTAMLTDKCRNALSTDAEVLAAADNSCLTHIGGGLSRMRAGMRVMHYAEILAAREHDLGPSAGHVDEGTLR
ncbi:(Fe-S)-binding protein [Phytomonospora sp. NPDC050363]|uniref:(Fe-S)-binding protein n=1 Tax=Phytomonospora sp. NPDC050363 TaxID=3155642 RepID=UPI0033E75EB2